MEYRVELRGVVEGLLEWEDAFGAALDSELAGLDAGLIVSVGESEGDVMVGMSVEASSLLDACSMASEAANRALGSVGFGAVEWECDSGGSAVEA